MPLKGDIVICYLCGERGRLKDIKRGAVKFRPYRGDFACSLCLDEVRSDISPMVSPDAPSAEDMKEIAPYLDD